MRDDQGIGKVSTRFALPQRAYGKGDPPDHFSVQKAWKDKFFNETIPNHSMAIAFLLEEGEIMNYLQQSNTKESVNFFDNYDEAFIWLNEYPTEDPYGTQLYSINQLVSGDTKR